MQIPPEAKPITRYPIGEVAMTTEQSRALALLADGEWHRVSELRNKHGLDWLCILEGLHLAGKIDAVDWSPAKIGGRAIAVRLVA